MLRAMPRPPRLAAGLATLATALALAAWRQAPPPTLAADAPARAFSAERAAATLGRLLAEGSPHPLGSPAQTAVRERLRYSNMPPALRGLGAAFMIAGLMAIGFMAFSGITL